MEDVFEPPTRMELVLSLIALALIAVGAHYVLPLIG